MVKIVYMATPEFSLPVLEMLNKHFDVVAVVTQPDKPVGRKQILTQSPVKKLARSFDIPVFAPSKVSEITENLRSYKPDFIITCAYGQIIPKDILELPKYYALNVHASLLPAYRGAAPIQRAIMAGDTETGITIMEMEETLDTGAMFSIGKVPITKSDNLKSIHDQLSILGANLLKNTIEDIVNGNYTKVPQDESQATYAHKITKEDEKIDFNRPTEEIFNHIRALNPVPGGYIHLSDKKVKLFDVEFSLESHSFDPLTITNITKDSFDIATADGFIKVLSLQVAGKKPSNARDFINSYLK